MKKLIAVIIVNILTTMRVIGVICLLPVYLEYGGVAAALLSIGCYFTDLIDGVIARACHVSTFFGSAYDGVADKMFSIANLIVLFNITKFAIMPILFEIAIIVMQTIKYHKNENVQSSKVGKLKTWIIALTVISLYLLIDIKSVTILPVSFVNYISELNQVKLCAIVFAPLYIFEILTLLSYMKFLKHIHEPVKIEIPKVDVKLKPNNTLKNKISNFCTLWFNFEFYEKYKDCAGLKQLKKSIKENNK